MYIVSIEQLILQIFSLKALPAKVAFPFPAQPNSYTTKLLAA